MDPRSAASVYKQASIENAPPLKIIHLLYEGALRFLGEAETGDPKANSQRFGNALSRVSEILSELRVALDHEAAPELSKNLESLYLFAEAQLVEARLGLTVEPLSAARDVLETLLDGWKQLEVELGAEAR